MAAASGPRRAEGTDRLPGTDEQPRRRGLTVGVADAEAEGTRSIEEALCCAAKGGPTRGALWQTGEPFKNWSRGESERPSVSGLAAPDTLARVPVGNVFRSSKPMLAGRLITGNV